MKNLTIQELEPLQNLINETSLSKLEHFFINSNLSKEERTKLVDILTGAFLPTALKNKKESLNHSI